MRLDALRAAAVGCALTAAVLMLVAVTRPVDLEVATHRAVFDSTGVVDIDPVMGRVERLGLSVACTGLGRLSLRIGTESIEEAVTFRTALLLDVVSGSAQVSATDTEGNLAGAIRAPADISDPDCEIGLDLVPEQSGWVARLRSSGGSEGEFVLPSPPDTRTVELSEARRLSGAFARDSIAAVEVDVLVLEEAGYSRSARGIQLVALVMLLIGLVLWWRSWPTGPEMDN